MVDGHITYSAQPPAGVLLRKSTGLCKKIAAFLGGSRVCISVEGLGISGEENEDGVVVKDMLVEDLW